MFVYRLLFLSIGLIYCIQSSATTIEDTVYINRGKMLAVDSTDIPYIDLKLATDISNYFLYKVEVDRRKWM